MNSLNQSSEGKRKYGIFTTTLRIFTGPPKLVHHHLHRHFNKKYKDHYRHARMLFGIDLVLVAIILGLVVTAAFTTVLRPRGSDALRVSVSIDAPTLTSGGENTFTISYKNTGREHLDDTSLHLFLPATTTITSSYPSFDLANTSFPIGTIAPSGSGIIVVRALSWANVGTSYDFSGAVSFRIRERNERAVTLIHQSFSVDKNEITTQVIGPTQNAKNGNTSIDLAFANSGSHTLPSFEIKPILPRGISIVSSEPILVDGRWQFHDIAPGANGMVHVTLSVPLTLKDAVLNFKTSITIDTETLDQGTISIPLTNTPEPIIVSVSIDHSSGIASPGEVIPLTISYKNQSAHSVNDATIEIHFSGPYAPTDDITIDESSEVQLKSIASQTEGIIHRLVALRQTPHDPAATNPLFIITPFSKIQNQKNAGEQTVLKMKTPVELTAVARYWTDQGDQIGRGPMPPTVGTATRYWITWQISPTTNELSETTITATLPKNVSWTNESSVTVGNPITWNPTTRRISWTIDSLPPTAANDQVIAGRFEVSLSPTQNDIGHSPPLLQLTTLHTHDTFTDTYTDTNALSVDTSLPADRRATGKGVVEK